MFDCSLYSADGIREAADVRHEIIEYQIEQLSLLGYKRDIKFIFPDGYSTPDFDLLGRAPRGGARNCARKFIFFTRTSSAPSVSCD